MQIQLHKTYFLMILMLLNGPLLAESPTTTTALETAIAKTAIAKTDIAKTDQPKADLTEPKVTDPKVTGPTVTGPTVTGPTVTELNVAKFELTQSDSGLRVLSWNVGEDAFVDRMAEFHRLVAHTRPDILLLDEVKPTSDESLLRQALSGPGNQPDGNWHIDFGINGGRQRGVIVSRFPLEKIPEFATTLAYPQMEYDHIVQHMAANERTYQNWTMQDGIATNAAIVLAGERRILVVTLDLQCCGSDPGSWQEYRRRLEVREIRRLIKAVLERTEVDGIIVAGDFNLVGTALPLVTMTNIDDPVFSNLLVAEVYQNNGGSWTWDGRGSQYPSLVMDFQLFTPESLKMTGGSIFNSELLSLGELELLGFEAGTSKLLSDHLPIVIDYQWK